MVQQRDNSDALIPVDDQFDAAEQPGISVPFTQDEIQDLLYGSDRPVEERLDRLKEMRGEMVTRESGDFGDQDPKDMISEIDRAIEELKGDSAYADENSDFDASVSIDPEDHLDTLSPDDVDARLALTGGDDSEDEDFDAELEDDEQAENLGLK